jgi:hypothetical protein
VCGERFRHVDEALFKCEVCNTYVHHACSDHDNLRHVETHRNGHGFADQWADVLWRCRACAIDQAPQDAARAAKEEQIKNTPALFLEAMAAAGNPGSMILRTAGGTRGLEQMVTGELRCWQVGKTQESASTQKGVEDVSWCFAVDGRLYRRGIGTVTKRFGKKQWVAALVVKGAPSSISGFDLNFALRRIARDQGVAL